MVEEQSNEPMCKYTPGKNGGDKTVLPTATVCCTRSAAMPEWMDVTLCGCECGRFRLTPAVLLWSLNTLAFIFHATMTCVIIGLSVPLDNWVTHGGVILPVYKTRIQFVAQSGNATTEQSSARIDFIPTYEQQEQGINLTTLTILFFALSAFFHLLIVVTAPWLTTYYWWIDECRQPLRYAPLATLSIDIRTFALADSAIPFIHRWIEYSVSASVRASLYCPLSYSHAL